MQKLSLVDETFDLNFISEYHMSIQLSLDGLSFCIMDGIQKKYVCLVHHPILSSTAEFSVKKIKELIDEEEYLKARYKSTRIIYLDSKATLIPPAYFKQELAEKVLEINFGESKNEGVFETTLLPSNDVLLGSIPSSLKNLIQDSFQDVSLSHECKPFLWNVLRQGNSVNQLAVLVREKYCWVVYLRDGKLTYINSFSIESDDDILFYTLNVVADLEIIPEETPLLVDGIVSKKSAIYHRFRQYIKHVKLAEAASDYQYSYLFSQLPDHRFNGLLNSYACEL